MSKFSRLRDFLERQSHNYRMILIRSAGANFLMNLTINYNSIYTSRARAHVCVFPLSTH